MEGVDLMDRLLEAYRPSIRGKKMIPATFCQSSQYYGCRCMEDSLSDWRQENNPH